MNDIVLDQVETKSNLDQEAVLNFLDHSVLLISQVQTAEDVDLLMDDFMSDDIVNIFENNKEMFSLINAVWFQAFKRIFVDQKSESFPLKMLWLPIMFKKFGWEIEDIETFEAANFKFRKDNENKNDIYKHLVELFLNGLKFNTHVAYSLFKRRLETLNVSPTDKENIESIITDLDELGWNKETQ